MFYLCSWQLVFDFLWRQNVFKWTIHSHISRSGYAILYSSPACLIRAWVDVQYLAGLDASQVIHLICVITFKAHEVCRRTHVRKATLMYSQMRPVPCFVTYRIPANMSACTIIITLKLHRSDRKSVMNVTTTLFSLFLFEQSWRNVCCSNRLACLF